MIKSRKFESQKLAEIFAAKVNGTVQVYFENNGFGKRIFEVTYNS